MDAISTCRTFPNSEIQTCSDNNEQLPDRFWWPRIHGPLNDIHFLNTYSMRWADLGGLEASNDRGIKCSEEVHASRECKRGGSMKFFNNQKMFQGNFPSPRSGHSMMTWGPNVLIFGGMDNSIGVYNDLHLLDTRCVTLEW